MMHITKQQFQPLIKAATDQIIARLGEKQDLRHRALSEKIGEPPTSMTDFDNEMIETFYSRLLPVTYRDWI